MKFLGLVLLIFALYSAEETVSYRLDNGFEVLMRKNEGDESQVIIQLMAKGGFSSLPEHDQIAGYFAGDLVWEAGFGMRDADQISNDLYNNYSDFYLDISPFYRKIECDTYDGGIKTCLQLIKEIFTKPRVDKIKSVQDKLVLGVNFNDSFEDCVLQVNSSNYPPFKKISLYELKRIDSSTVGDFFKVCFQNPEEFVCVIVGDFDEVKLKSLIKEILGSIPKKTDLLFKKNPYFPLFPKGITKESCNEKKRNDHVVKLTFPLTLTFNEINLRKLEQLAQIINNELTKYLKVNVDTGFELPFYPYTEAVWLTVQINSLKPLDLKLGDQIIEKLKQLKTSLPNLKEVESEVDDSYWLLDNNYLATELANFALWKWDYHSIDHKLDLNLNELSMLLNNWIDLNHYSEVLNE